MIIPVPRIGFGYDVHRLQEGYPLWLGGIQIPSAQGAVGHSDADVLIHALCDAILGAAALRDIGFHFPDTEEEYRGISSILLLERVMKKIHAKGYSFGNMDATLVLQQPRISPFIPEMQIKLAQTLQCTPDAVSIKATTSEKLGFEGRREGVSAYAVVILFSAPPLS